MEILTTTPIIQQRFLDVRKHTEKICEDLQPDDFSVQPVGFVSPPKWHLGHTTWFFEQFVLSVYKVDYKLFSEDFAFYFNSYYNNVGERILRVNRGNMTRPTIDEVFQYRNYVTQNLFDYLQKPQSKEIMDLVEIGLQHEQQHQELLHYDIKYIFGHQPAFPGLALKVELKPESDNDFLKISEGVYQIGHTSKEFCFDNELGVHKTYIHDCEISKRLVTNGEYLEFINAGGYTNHNYWHADGWDWVKDNGISLPMYWHKTDNGYKQYTLNGLRELNADLPVSHVSYYEAWAFAEWKGMRLPPEFGL